MNNYHITVNGVDVPFSCGRNKNKIYRGRGYVYRVVTNIVIGGYSYTTARDVYPNFARGLKDGDIGFELLEIINGALRFIGCKDILEYASRYGVDDVELGAIKYRDDESKLKICSFLCVETGSSINELVKVLGENIKNLILD